MPKEDILICQTIENDYLRATYNLLFSEVRIKYYDECISLLSKISLEDETLFEYYHYLSEIIRFYSEALSETRPWYYIAVYCVESKKDKNILSASQKMLEALQEIYQNHGENLETEFHYISGGIGHYSFTTDSKVIGNLLEELINIKIP